MDKKNYRWLTCLRGGCAILVVLRHLWSYIDACTNNALVDFLGIFVWRFFDSGKVGVVGFFLISGFLLPKSLSSKKVGTFIIDRIIRLYPTYWFSMLLAIIFVGGFGVVQVLVNLTMLQTFFGVADLVGVYWTMSIEMVLYGGCIVFFKQIQKQNIKCIDILYILLGIGTLGMSFLRFVTDVKLPVALPLMLFVAFVGYYFRLVYDKDFITKQLTVRLLYFVVILLPSCVMAYNKDMGFNERWYVYCVSYIAGMVVFCLFMKFDLYSKFLNGVGVVSYSLYLTHRIVISSMCDKGQSISLLYLLGVMFAIVILAILTYVFIEKRSYLYLKKLVLRRPISSGEKND